MVEKFDLVLIFDKLTKNPIYILYVCMYVLYKEKKEYFYVLFFK